jgi:hypothetical protein
LLLLNVCAGARKGTSNNERARIFFEVMVEIKFSQQIGIVHEESHPT